MREKNANIYSNNEINKKTKMKTKQDVRRAATYIHIPHNLSIYRKKSV